MLVIRIFIVNRTIAKSLINECLQVYAYKGLLKIQKMENVIKINVNSCILNLKNWKIYMMRKQLMEYINLIYVLIYIKIVNKILKNADLYIQNGQ